MRAPIIMEKLDISIRSATRDDVARILELFESAVSSSDNCSATQAIPLDSNRPKLTPNGIQQNYTFTR